MIAIPGWRLVSGHWDLAWIKGSAFYYFCPTMRRYISKFTLFLRETRISNEQWESNSFVTVSMTCWHHIKQSMTSINLIGLFGAVQWLVGSSRIFMEINQIALFNFHKIHIFNARLKWVKSLKCWFVCACGVVARK